MIARENALSAQQFRPDLVVNQRNATTDRERAPTTRTHMDLRRNLRQKWMGVLMKAAAG